MPKATPRPVVHDPGMAACLARSLAGRGGPNGAAVAADQPEPRPGSQGELTRPGGDDPSGCRPGSGRRRLPSPCTTRTRPAGREPDRWDGG
jgi:hypothetical protein